MGVLGAEERLGIRTCETLFGCAPLLIPSDLWSDVFVLLSYVCVLKMVVSVVFLFDNKYVLERYLTSLDYALIGPITITHVSLRNHRK